MACWTTRSIANPCTPSSAAHRVLPPIRCHGRSPSSRQPHQRGVPAAALVMPQREHTLPSIPAQSRYSDPPQVQQNHPERTPMSPDRWRTPTLDGRRDSGHFCARSPSHRAHEIRLSPRSSERHPFDRWSAPHESWRRHAHPAEPQSHANMDHQQDVDCAHTTVTKPHRLWPDRTAATKGSMRWQSARVGGAKGFAVCPSSWNGGLAAALIVAASSRVSGVTAPWTHEILDQ